MVPGRLRLPPGASLATDPTSGRPVIAWTADGRSQHLYFTCPSITADDRWLVVLSERDGGAGLWAADRSAGTWRRLDRNRNGIRRAYCHPLGGPAGLTKASVCLDPGRGISYAVIDDRLWRFPLAVGPAEPICTLDAGWSCGFAHVAPDGSRLCLTLVDDGTLAAETAIQRDQMEAAARVVAAGRSRSRLLEIDTASGAARTRCEVPFWITHVQYDPSGADRVIFNSEGPWRLQDRIPRIWLHAAGAAPSPLFAQDPSERVGHENILPDGSSIVYHGSAADGHFICRRGWDGALLERVALPERPEAHHATPTPDAGGFLADCHDGLVHELRRGPAGLAFRPLAVHGVEDWTEQDDHPHPIANPDGRGVVFTAHSASGRDVREVLLG
jgi:hypothetical protein